MGKQPVSNVFVARRVCIPSFLPGGVTSKTSYDMICVVGYPMHEYRCRAPPERQGIDAFPIVAIPLCMRTSLSLGLTCAAFMEHRLPAIRRCSCRLELCSARNLH